MFGTHVGSQLAASAEPEAPLLAWRRLADAAVQRVEDGVRAAVVGHQQLLHAQQDEVIRQRLRALRDAPEMLGGHGGVVGREEAHDEVASRSAVGSKDPAGRAALSLLERAHSMQPGDTRLLLQKPY